MTVIANLPEIRSSLLLDFASGKVDPRIQILRAGVATCRGVNGLTRVVGENVPRIDFDPASGVCRGLLGEASAINLLTTAISQSLAVSTQAYTLSFYGTGTVTLSGAYAAVIAGNVLSRKNLTFTPHASGVLDVSFSGDVQRCQLEIGTRPSTYIPANSTSAVMRSQDAIQIPISQDWFNPEEGVFVVEAQTINPVLGENRCALTIGDGTWSNYIGFRFASSLDRTRFNVTSGGVDSILSNEADYSPEIRKIAIAYKKDDFAIVKDGVVSQVSMSGNVPSGMNRLILGNFTTGGVESLNGWLRKIIYYPRRLINPQLQSITK